MKRALVVGAMPAPGGEAFYRGLLRDAPLVIAADGGAALAVALGRPPEIAVGDFDSSAPGTPEALAAAGVRTVVHPAAKDETDLDLAVGAARDEGSDEVTLTAAFTGRLDHTLAALGTLLRASDMLAVAREPGLSVWVVGGRRSSLTLSGPPGSTVSVLAPEGASGVTLQGFAFPLTEAELPPLASLGVSNVTVDESVTVRVRGGRVLVLAPFEHGTPPLIAS